jgi:uncharacterized protein (DUF1810 family)
MHRDDVHDLARFVEAQKDVYATAIGELRRGRKETHWMWFIFPQIAGLGFSATAQKYAIQSLDEAQAYLAHAVLGPRLRECAEAVLAAQVSTAEAIIGSTDAMKLQSSATLFDLVSPPGSVFRRVLDRYYDGATCRDTLARVQQD